MVSVLLANKNSRAYLVGEGGFSFRQPTCSTDPPGTRKVIIIHKKYFKRRPPITTCGFQEGPLRKKKKKTNIEIYKKKDKH